MTRTQRLLVFTSCCLFLSLPARAFTYANEISSNVPTLWTLTLKDLEQSLGRKMTWKEKLAFKLIQRKLKKSGFSHQEVSFAAPSLSPCSKIVMKNGDIIEADIIQITPEVVKYKRCGKPNDPEIIVYKKDILSVQAGDGEVIFRNTSNTQNRTQNQKTGYNADTKIDPLAIASLATGASGLLVGLLLSGVIGILAGIVGIVLGAISLTRIKRNPDQFSGRGLALAGMISGITIVGLFLILLAILL